jgi:predicted metal-dependent hydrolase
MFFRRMIIRRRVIHPDKARITFADGQVMSLMGAAFTISVTQNSESKYSTARAKSGVVKIKLAGGLNAKSLEKHVSSLSRRAITRALLPIVEARVRQFNDQYFQSELGAIRLKDNVSNWGSCSRQNNINLDFRLLFGPPEVFDAVILHELAHTKHRNHSKAYYSTLLSVMPDNKERLRWLRDNGHRLTSAAAGTIPYPNADKIEERKETPSIGASGIADSVYVHSGLLESKVDGVTNLEPNVEQHEQNERT